MQNNILFFRRYSKVKTGAHKRYQRLIDYSKNHNLPHVVSDTYFTFFKNLALFKNSKVIIFGINSVLILIILKLFKIDHSLCIRMNLDYLNYFNIKSRYICLLRINLIAKLNPFIIFQSNYDKNSFNKFFDNKKNKVIYNDFNGNYKTFNVNNHKSKKIIFVGSDEPRKKLCSFVKLANNAQHYDYKFLIYSDSKRKNSNNITYCGYVTDESMFNDAFLLLSLSCSDSFPNVILESIKYGVPVLSVRLPILEELDFPSLSYINDDKYLNNIRKINYLKNNYSAYKNLFDSQFKLLNKLSFDWEYNIINS